MMVINGYYCKPVYEIIKFNPFEDIITDDVKSFKNYLETSQINDIEGIWIVIGEYEYTVGIKSDGFLGYDMFIIETDAPFWDPLYIRFF